MAQETVDMIKLRISRWGDYPKLSGWDKYNHKSSVKSEAEGDLSTEAGNVTTEARGWNSVRKVSQTKECRHPPGARKGLET